MIPQRLKQGDTIGLAVPCHLAKKERYQPIIEALKVMGYRVKCASNFYSSGWGYIASNDERAEDINELISDDDVKMIFFGGGEGADDVLPLLDYETAKQKPKLYLSYSDGTSILNSIWQKTGIVTSYGQMPGIVINPTQYNLEQFSRHICALSPRHIPAAPWHVLTQGRAEGTLIGGYLDNFLFLIAAGRIPIGGAQQYILFLEDHEQFFSIHHESVLLARLEQLGIMPHVRGILFGHYSDPVNEQLLQRLALLGKKWNIPVAYCDDFGHGVHHAILPIGAYAALDTIQSTLEYQYL